MVNLYNASQDALAEMRAGNYHNVKLEIEHSSNGRTRWIFTKKPEGFFSKIYDAAHCFSQMHFVDNGPSGPATEFKFGDEIRPYHEKAEAFHKSLRNAVKKASYLGEGLHRIKNEGFAGCVQHDSYWCETFSPSHISKPIQSTFKNPYEQAKQQSPDLDFDEWIQSEEGLGQLESKEGSRDISSFQVAYLTPEQRAQHRVEFRKEGEDTFLYYQGSPLNTELFETEAGKGRAIFVIGPDHELYVGNHVPYQFHHTSFFAGRPVIGAGEIITDPNGKLIAITDKSGHYKPRKKQMIDALKVLETEKRIDLTNTTLIIVPKNGQMNGCGRYNAHEFHTSGGTIRPSELELQDYS